MIYSTKKVKNHNFNILFIEEYYTANIGVINNTTFSRVTVPAVLQI